MLRSSQALNESASALKTSVNAVETDVQGKLESDRSLDSGFQHAASKASNDLTAQSSVVRSDVSQAVSSGLSSVNEAGVGAITIGGSLLTKAATNMSTMKDPRENIKESVVNGAKNVMTELSSGISGVKDVATKVVGDIEKMEEEEIESSSKIEETVGAEVKEVRCIEWRKKRAPLSCLSNSSLRSSQIGACLEAEEKRGSEAIARISSYTSSSASGIFDIRDNIRRYADEVMRVDEEVEEVGPRKFIGVEEVVYATPGAETIDEAFGDGEDEEKVSFGK